MAIWLIGAAYLHSLIPGLPQSIWLLGFIVLSSAINIIGLKFASKLNVMLLLLQCLVMVAFGALCIHYVLGDPTRSHRSVARVRVCRLSWRVRASRAIRISGLTR